MRVNMLDIGAAEFDVSVESTDKESKSYILTQKTPVFYASAGDVVTIKGHHTKVRRSLKKIIFISVLTFFMSVIEALFITPKSLISKVKPYLMKKVLSVKRNQNTSTIFYEEGIYLDFQGEFQKPTIRYGEEYYCESTSYTIDEESVTQTVSEYKAMTYTKIITLATLPFAFMFISAIVFKSGQLGFWAIWTEIILAAVCLVRTLKLKKEIKLLQNKLSHQ